MTVEHAPHAVRRKAYSSRYALTNIARFLLEMHKVTLELVSVRLLFHELISLIVDMLITSRPCTLRPRSNSLSLLLTAIVFGLVATGKWSSSIPYRL